MAMKKRVILISFCAFALSACESTKDNLGLTRAPPDEFQVVKRAPLSVPPDYTLRPPAPGAPRPQELSANADAAQTVFGEGAAEPRQNVTSGEAILLVRAGADEADPQIRETVDQESAAFFDRNKPVAEKLFGIGGDKNQASASVVNAKAEAERLERNTQEGKPVTEGETPSIEE